MVMPCGAKIVLGVGGQLVRERGRVRNGGCGAEVRCGRGAQPQWSEVRSGRLSVLLLFLHHHLSLCAVRQFGEATSHQFPLNYKSIAGTAFSLSLSRPPLCIINHSLFQCPNPLPSVPPSCSRTGDFSLSLCASVCRSHPFDLNAIHIITISRGWNSNQMEGCCCCGAGDSSLCSLSDCVLFFWVLLLFWCAWKISSDKQSGPPPRVDRFEQVRKIASVYAIFLGPPSPFACIVGFTRCLQTHFAFIFGRGIRRHLTTDCTGCDDSLRTFDPTQ